jgi:sialidase-1
LVQQFAVRRDGRDYAVSVMSDDDGATWRAGQLVGPGLDENKSVELDDGSLLLNSRARPYRLVARPTDGGVTWSRPVPDPQLPDPSSNGAIIRYDPAAASDDPRARWLLFSNTADSAQRRGLTVRLSCDDGRTWSEGRTVVPGPAGYSTLAILPTGDVGLLFERGRYEAISFLRMPLATIGSCR